jgi:hypothetical protein
VGTGKCFTKDVEGFIRQRPLELRKHNVLFGIGMPYETFRERSNVVREVRIRRMRGAQRVQCGKNACTFLTGERRAIITAQLARTRNVDVSLFDAHMRFDGANDGFDGLSGVFSAWLQGQSIEKLADVAMLLLQEIKCIHGPSPYLLCRIERWNR